MLKEIVGFFKKEPRYFWLLCVLLAFYAFFFYSGVFREPEPKPSKEVAAFQENEEKWNQEMERDGAFLEFSRKKPVLALLFRVMTGFFLIAFLAGAAMDLLFWLNGAFREKMTNVLDPPLNPTWPFSLFFKVVLLFMFWGILLSALMGAVEAFFPKWASDNFYMIVHTMLLQGIALYYMVRFLKQKGSRWQELGLQVSPKAVFREIKVGILGYLGVLPLFVLIVVILFAVANLIHYEPPSHPLMNVFLEEETRAPFLVVISFLLGAVIGPVFEELFFRGFCYPIFRNKWGKVWAMVLSAAFFAGIHHSGFVFWPIFALGIMLAYLYEKRRSLIASITLHVIHNTLFISYFFLVKQMFGERGL